MRRTIQLILLIAISICFESRVFSQTIAGGEVYYELIAPLKYKITAHVYRYCDYSPLVSLNGNVYGGALSVALNFQRIGIRKINDTCNNPCNKQNDISNPGIEQHTFIDTVDFNYAPYDVFVSKGICIVNFGVKQSGRLPYITTLTSSNFFIDASTNICLSNIKNNASPQFSIEPKFKVGCNVPTIYSAGLVDTTNIDSFAFELAEIESNYQTPVSYNGSFTAQIPMTPFCLPTGVINCKALPNAKPPRGFAFDGQTGNLAFTPTNCNEVGVVKIKVHEYRYNPSKKTYEWLGYVCREMTMEVNNMKGNRIPEIAKTLGNNKVCELSNLLTKFQVTDADSSDTTQLFWDAGLPQATFKIKDSRAREKEAEFNWLIKFLAKKREDYYFTVGAYDKQCNLNLTSKTYRLNVIPSPHYTYRNTLSSCGQIDWVVSIFDSIYPNAIGTCLTTIKSLNTNKIIYQYNGLFGSTTLHENGRFTITHALTHNLGSPCILTLTDTININNAIELPTINNNKDSIVCENATIQFEFKKGPIKNIKHFWWYVNRDFLNQTDTIVKVKIVEDSRVKIMVENDSGCFSELGVRYNLKRHYPMVSTDETVCYGQLYTVVSNGAGLKKPITYLWNINGKDSLTNDCNLHIEIKEFKKIILTVVDSMQCRFTDSVHLDTWAPIGFHLKATSQVCKDSLIAVKAEQINAAMPYKYFWYLNNDSLSRQDSLLNINLVKDAQLKITLLDANGCTAVDSTKIKVIVTPVVELSDAIFCIGDSVKIVPRLYNPSSFIIYDWTIDQTTHFKEDKLKFKLIKSTPVSLKVTNGLGCSSSDTAVIQMHAIKNFKINGAKKFHPSSLISLNAADSFKNYEWSNGSRNRVDSFWANSLGASGNYQIWCKASDTNGCIYNDTIEINTASFLNVNTFTNQGLRIFPNPVIDDLNIEIPTKANFQIYSTVGKLVYQSILEKGNNTIDLHELQSGVYLAKLLLNGQEVSVKIVKD